MAEFLAYRIICGKLTFDNVPARLKADVKAVLIEYGYGDLTEGEV